MTLHVLNDVGTVVEDFLGGSGDRVAPAVVDSTFLTPPVGVMLTNAESTDDGIGGQTGGYCVVGCSDPMVVKISASSGDPAAGAKLYLQKGAGDEGGASDQAEIDSSYTGPCPLGNCLPVGPTGATRLRYMVWEPQPPNGVTAQRSIALTITSNTTLVDFAVAPVKIGRRYLVDAGIQFFAGAAGGIDVAYLPSAGLGGFQGFVAGQIFATTPAVTLAAALTSMGPIDRLGVAGPTDGFVRLSGLLECLADGTISLQASQHVSNGTPTVVNPSSWFRVTEV